MAVEPPNSIIRVLVNGEVRYVPQDSTVSDLLRSLGLEGSQRVGVERNKQIVPRGDHGCTILQPDDRLEVVSFVGGG